MLAWRLWTSVPTVALWEAVALVLGINPQSLRHQRDRWQAGPGPWPSFERRSFPSQAKRDAFANALSFAERAVNDAGPIHLRAPLGWGRNRRTAQVSLAEVVAFFVSCEWPDIPAPLLALVSAAGDTTTPPVVPVPAAVEPAPVSKETTPPLLTTPEIAEAFDGIGGQTAKQWRDKLGDVNNHQWLIDARAQKATAPKPATWWPIKFAELLRTRDATDESLNRAFLTAPKLKPWLPLWQEKRRERNAFGQ
jgi:hypothetical protein